MIVHANKITKEILGYATIGSFSPDSDEVVFQWEGIIPEPTHSFHLGEDNRSVIENSDSEKSQYTNNIVAIAVRARRDELLRLSDYTQVGDSSHPGTKEEWRTYRQALRDIPQQSGFPNTITWPNEPL